MLNTMQQPEAGPPPMPEPAAVAKASERGAPRPAQRSGSAEPTLAQLAWTLLDRRWIVAAIGGVVLALVALYLFVTPPAYYSSILIQVEGRSRPVTAFEDLATLFQEETPTEGEMRILKSRTLLDSVVEQLGLDIAVRARTFPIVGDALARRSAGPELAPAPLDLVRFAWGGERIRVERLTVSEVLLGEPLLLTALEGGRYRIAASDGTPLVEGEVGKAVTGTEGDRTLALEVSELVARPGTEFTVLKRRRIDVIEGLQSALRIEEQGRATGLVELSMTGGDPSQIAAILDAVSTTYLRQSVERTSAEAAKTLKVLEGQLPVLKANLEKAERSLNAFQSKNGTVNLSVEGQGMLQRVMEIDRAIAANELQRAELAHRHTEQYPQVSLLAERNLELERQRTALEARLRSMPSLELQSTRLARHVRVATELYLLVLNRAEELRIVKSGWIGNVRVLERAAVPHRPISPKPTLVVTLGLLLALGGGIAAALVVNALDRGVRNPDEIEAEAGLPVFATIPRSRAQRRLTRRGKRGPVPVLSVAAPADEAVEDLRSLRTSVQFTLRQAKNNVVAVSGLGPGAGKSFVSANLAHLLAAADGRVLLVDADLRRGGLHRQFGLEAQPGLADLLGGAAALDAVVKPTDTPRLDLVPAGTLPPNPAELLAGERLQQLLADLGRRYQVVIVDTPPILSVADAALVGRHAGVNLLVIRAGEHSVDEILYVVKRLARSGVAVRGGVLNDLRASFARYHRSPRYRGYALGGAARDA